MIHKLTILHPKEKGKLMQTLIEASIFRKIKIIHALVMDYDSLSEKEIASLNHCSLSTAKNDLAELQKEYSHIFGMEIEYGHVRFTKKNRAQTSRIIKALFSESLNLQLILEIFDNPFKTRQDYCRGLRISEASFYRAIKNINKVFKSYGFLIQFNQGGYYLRGKNEDELRKFIVSLYLETKTMEECFIRIPFKHLKKLVGDNVLDLLPLDFDLYNTYYIYYAYVSLIRESHDFNLFKSKIDITYEEYDLLAHYFPTLKQKHLYSIRQSFLHQIDPWTNLEDKNEALTVFRNFISEFAALNQKLCNEVLAEKLLLVCILTYGGFEIFPAKYKIIFNRIDVFIDQFRKNNPEVYESFQELFHKTNAQLKRPFVYQGNQLLFWIEILSPEFFIQSGEIKVKIASDLGLEHQNFYKNIFSDLFADIKIIENDCKDKADFIITNHFIDEDELPLIFIGDYPSIEDLTNIHKKMLHFLEI